MPRLDTSADSASSYASTLALLFAIHPPQPRREIARSLLLQSVRLRLITERGSSRQDDLERLEGFRRGVLPLRIRPAFVFLNILCLLCLAVLGFHPRGQAYVPINDKILHFICFLLVSARELMTRCLAYKIRLLPGNGHLLLYLGRRRASSAGMAVAKYGIDSHLGRLFRCGRTRIRDGAVSSSSELLQDGLEEAQRRESLLTCNTSSTKHSNGAMSLPT